LRFSAGANLALCWMDQPPRTLAKQLANVWQDEKKAGLEPAKNHTLRG
jgi:hypothetical protein